ncbi:hypothetical protein F5Y04DRAFT_119905 [Hypomontagnella monticulosa]|nr:hypothetical protein F5Y04DRAFT_119905 [Hypomontagnella monticulosa]
MAKPWIPRMHLWEIDDQPWFPSFLRGYVQTGLTHAWTVHIPVLQASSPATIVAELLRRVLGASVSKHTYIDFCAGAGGPTPFIERALNSQLAPSARDTPAATPTRTVPATASAAVVNGERRAADDSTPSYAAVADPDAKSAVVRDAEVNGGDQKNGGSCDNRVDFVLTDLHPHVESWEAASKKSDWLTYVSHPVDAANAPEDLLQRYGRKGGSKKGIFRLFNLAFHHFDDDLARAILKNTVETSEGFGIFELQDRSFIGLLTCFVFGFFIFLIAPLLYWWSPVRLFWVYIIPVVPFVLVFDGLISCLRTRTATEVETLLRTCGTDTDGWEVHSGRERFLWPVGFLHWIICTKKAT